jgi:predicted NUDIX family phosphoesterase
MSIVETERVLVVPTQVFHKAGYFQGFCGDVNRYLAEMLQPKHIRYIPRAEAEQDPSFKQLIPYVLFQHRSDEGEISVFQYTRGKGQGENRLHSKRSVGIGGHISSVDEQSALLATYEEGMRRELDEEVEINTPYTQQCIGLINDDLTEVGKVHLGVVHLVDVETPDIRPREIDLLGAGFAPVAQMLGELERFESWSQICLEALFRRSL